MAALRAQTATSTDADLLAALRGGDDAAFRLLVERHHPNLVQLARSFVQDRAVADAVVRDTWREVLSSLASVETGANLSVVLFGIVIGHAQARAPLAETADAATGPSLDPARFRGPEDQYYGGWRTFPASWGNAPDERLGSPEAIEHTRGTIDGLPSAERQVVILRDVHGCTAAAVSELLGISEAKQRALLNRGRALVRDALASFLAAE